MRKESEIKKHGALFPFQLLPGFNDNVFLNITKIRWCITLNHFGLPCRFCGLGYWELPMTGVCESHRCPPQPFYWVVCYS